MITVTKTKTLQAILGAVGLLDKSFSTGDGLFSFEFAKKCSNHAEHVMFNTI